MNPVLIFIPVAAAIVLFFIFKPSKKEKPVVNVMPDPSEPPISFEPTPSFVDNTSIQADQIVEATPQPSEVLEAAPAPEVLFEKLPEVSPVEVFMEVQAEAPIEVQAEAPAPEEVLKPKAKKAPLKKKPAAKK
jgi:hypothetical protein